MDKRIAVMAFLITAWVITAMAYPQSSILIFDDFVNKTLLKEVIQYIPEEYYEYVDVIEFKNGFVRCQNIDEFDRKRCYEGYSWAYWDKAHDCYYGKIILNGKLNRDDLYRVLQHEIGHIYELCKLKRDITTEDFADGFRIT